ncbi:MAG: SpoIIE family protein phosphatase [Bacteroidota bacterium]
MSRLLFLTILCFVFFVSRGQKNSRFESLVDSANKYENIDWNLSYSYAKMAMQNKDVNFSYEDVISLNTIFDTYYQKLNMLDSAFSINKQSLKLATEHKDTTLIAYSLNNMAGIYDLTGNYRVSIQMYKKALAILETLKDIKQIGNTNHNMAIPYSKLELYDSAKYYTSIALLNYQKVNDYSGIALCYDSYGSEADRLANYTEAIKFYKMEIENFKKANETANLIIPYQNIAETYLKIKDYTSCKQYLDLAMTLAIELGSKVDMYDVSNTYAKYYEATGDYKTANLFMRRYYEGKDTMINNQLKTELSDQKSEFDRENSEIMLTIQKLEAEKNLRSKQSLTWVLVLSSMFFIIVLILSVNKYRAKQKSFVELNEYKNQLISQKEKIEETQKEIIDSINYAKRIQSAIMPKEEDVLIYFPESFLLYKPKNIVAGDFYFFETTSTHVFYAAADCTGHGVPGALVSVICSNALTRCVHEFNLVDPGKILDKTRELVLKTFQRSGDNVKDGMDISLCVFEIEDLKSNSTISVKWAGANNTLWYINFIQEGPALKKIKANKQAIGHNENQQPYTTHDIKLNKGDILYLFTDGYADQFGGIKEKKFKAAHLEKHITTICTNSLQDQKILLEKSFNQWMGNLEQVDDVCVIGIRI